MQLNMTNEYLYLYENNVRKYVSPVIPQGLSNTMGDIQEYLLNNFKFREETGIFLTLDLGDYVQLELKDKKIFLYHNHEHNFTFSSDKDGLILALFVVQEYIINYIKQTREDEKEIAIGIEVMELE